MLRKFTNFEPAQAIELIGPQYSTRQEHWLIRVLIRWRWHLRWTNRLPTQTAAFYL